MHLVNTARLAPVLLLALSACTTAGKVQDIETQNFASKGSASVGEIGVNGDDKVVVRENAAAQDELTVLDLANTHLRDEVEREVADLQACREQLSDQRLGGNGEVAPPPDIEALKQQAEVSENVGLDEEGELRVVREQAFAERLKAERKYAETLKKLRRSLVQQRQSCERRLAMVRQQHGIAGKKYQADGYFLDDGTWVETKRGEQSLSDAFEISAKAKAKASKARAKAKANSSGSGVSETEDGEDAADAADGE